LEEVGFCLPRCAHVEAKGGNSNANDIPISKNDNKLCIMFHLEKITMVNGCLGKTSLLSFLK